MVVYSVQRKQVLTMELYALTDGQMLSHSWPVSIWDSRKHLKNTFTLFKMFIPTAVQIIFVFYICVSNLHTRFETY